ncbi:hypothetical protein Q6A51_25970 [Pseudomonas sp. KFB-139]|uniref:Uncharacterized protein n=2 Tax=Pseudomonas syringae group TaxID=136849 RepID=A0ABT9CXL6_9PSED|nr:MULTISPECIES: hypothetical protein [Pseudomonas]MDO7930226.1 hypothetical protein [Pseudomonas sp. KFB-138]
MHVNGMEGFCHVVIAFDNRSPHPGVERLQGRSCILHYPKKPSLQNAMFNRFKTITSHCFIRIFIQNKSGMQAALSVPVTILHARYLKMNMTLSVLNAVALVALVAFHFQDTRIHDDKIGTQPQSYELVRKAPQLAIMSDRSVNAATLGHEVKEAPLPNRAEERWIF